jgi:hypothetical protein
VAFFGALFAARTDVYATRFENPRTGKAGWIPAVRGGRRKGTRHEDRNYLPLTRAVLAAHLKGEVHIGPKIIHGTGSRQPADPASGEPSVPSTPEWRLAAVVCWAT